MAKTSIGMKPFSILVTMTSETANVTRVYSGDRTLLGCNIQHRDFAEFADGDYNIDGFTSLTDKNIIIKSITASAPPKFRFEDSFTESGYFMPKNAKLFWTVVAAMAQKNCTNALLVGATGVGKTSMAREIARQNGMDYYCFDCGTVETPTQFFGELELKNASANFVLNRGAEMIVEGNSIVVFDEINRASPLLTNSLLGLLGFARETTINNTRIKVGQNTILVSTANIGNRFTGTYALDSALLNRLRPALEVLPMTKDVQKTWLMKYWNVPEQQTNEIVKVCEALNVLSRDNDNAIDISPRTIGQIAEMIVAYPDLTVRQAVEFSIVYICPEDLRKEVLDVVTNAIGAFSIKQADYD